MHVTGIKTMSLKTFFSFLIVGVIGIGLVLPRFLWLDTIPSGLNWDEAAYGYNALSLLKTGRDEWGMAYPLYLKSFGEYKPALFSYLIEVSFLLSGISDYSIRLVPALLGIMSLIAAYVFFRSFISKNIALLSVLFLAVSPWHFHFSRIAMDPILSFCFALIGFSLFISRNKFVRYLGLAVLLLSMYSYHSAKLIVPVITTCLLLCFKAFRKGLTLPTGLVIFFGISLISLSIFTPIGQRTRDTFILSKPEIINQVNEITYRSNITHIPLSRVLNNKLLSSFPLIIHNYFVHFQPDFWFFGNNLGPRHAFSLYGNLLLTTLPFILFGFCYGITRRRETDNFFFVWLIVAPLPAAFTDDVPHAGRAFMMLVPLAYFFALGVIHTATLITHSFFQKSIFAAIVLSLCVNFALYIRDYYLFFPEESYTSFQGQMKSISIDSFANQQQFSRIFLDMGIQNEYIFLAWYNQIDPLLIQQLHRLSPKSEIPQIGQIYLLPLSEKEYYCSLELNNARVVSPRNFIETKGSIARREIFSQNRFTPGTVIAESFNTSSFEATLSALISKRCESNQ